jgi:hypothetical protein
MAGFLGMQSKAFYVEEDLEALFARLRQRLYPETLPVLASYWLKTVSASGYGRRQWKELNGLLKRALSEQFLDGPSRQAIVDLQTWIQQTLLLTGQAPRPKPPRSERICATLSSDLLQPYINRLLNEWLPVEVAHLLVDEDASSLPADGGIPAMAIGRALEGLLVRERLSPRALEMLLQPEPFSPRCVYTAEAEILQDVVLSLLGRTWASPRSVMPATLLCVAPDSLLPTNYVEAVHHAFLVPKPGGEEVHVPIAPAQALEILKDEPVRIGSVMVTTDGRWWEAENLQSGEPHSIVYRPMGRLRLDYVADHVRLRVPWPRAQLSWSGGTPFPDTFEIFGREWRLSQWEQDGERAWLHLVFSRVLPMTGTVPVGDAGLRRLPPASVGLAWSALEKAVTNSIVQSSCQPIEQLRHSDLIPLGRAISALTACLMSRRPQPYVAIEAQLRGIRYLEAQVSSEYGRVPWSILPTGVHAGFFRFRSDPVMLELLNQVFASLPERLSTVTSAAPRPGKAPTGEFTTLRPLTTTFAGDQRFSNPRSEFRQRPVRV